MKNSHLLAALLFAGLSSAYGDGESAPPPNTPPAPVGKQSVSYVGASSALAFPAEGCANVSFTSRFGLATYNTASHVTRPASAPGSTDMYLTGSFVSPQLHFGQVFGYGRYFYTQFRESFGLGFVNQTSLDNSPADAGTIGQRPRDVYFMDIDATLYGLMTLSETHRIMLQPSIGFSLGSLYVKGSDNTRTGSDLNLYKATYYSPTAGIGIGFMPTQRLGLRLETSVLFPNIKRKMKIREDERVAVADQLMKAARHGIRMSLDIRSQLTSVFSLSAEVSMTGMNGYRSPVANTFENNDYFNSAYYLKTAALFGLDATY